MTQKQARDLIEMSWKKKGCSRLEGAEAEVGSRKKG